MRIEHASQEALSQAARWKAARARIEAPRLSLVAPLPVAEEMPPITEALPYGPIDKTATFEAFVTDAGNENAFRFARCVAEAVDGDAAASPLVLHGPPGTGKSHLAQASVSSIRASSKVAYFFEATCLMLLLGDSARRDELTIMASKAEFVVVDDIHLAKGQAASRALCNWLRWLLANRKTQVALTTTTPIFELEFGDEVCSRLSGGLCVNIAGPAAEARLQLISAFSEKVGLRLLPNIATALALALPPDVRTVHGAVNILSMRAKCGGFVTSAQDALSVVSHLLGGPVHQKPPKIEVIQSVVADHYGVAVKDITSARRTANIVLPRQVAMHLAKMLTQRSFPEIGRRFGGRDHTTILHSVRKIEALCGSDPSFSQEISALSARVEHVAAGRP